MNELLMKIEQNTFLTYDILNNIMYTLIAFIVLWVIKKLNIVVSAKTSKTIDDPKKRYRAQKILDYLYRTLMLIVLIIIWQDLLPNMLTFFGLFTAGLAVALKEPLVNIVGGVYILSVNPFRVGDRIEIGQHVGDVIDIQLVQISLLEVGNRISGEQSTGRIINIPCAQVFTLPITNYEKGFKYIWDEMAVRLSIDSNWKKAKDILSEIVNKNTRDMIEEAEAQIEEAGKRYMIYYTSLTPIIYTHVEEGKIILTLRYLCEPRQARGMEHQMWEEILTTFSNHADIKMV